MTVVGSPHGGNETATAAAIGIGRLAGIPVADSCHGEGISRTTVHRSRLFALKSLSRGPSVSSVTAYFLRFQEYAARVDDHN
jgi:hypothetical protein